MDKLFSYIENIEFDEHADLSRYSTMKLKASSPLAIIKTKKALIEFIKICHANNIEYRPLGWGANQLIVDQAAFIYLHLEFEYDSTIFEAPRDEYDLPASVSLAKLTSHAAKFGLKGWEVFTGVPASLGGAIFMNAGTNLGEIGQIVKSVNVIDKFAREREVVINEKSFSYRHNNICNSGDIIVSAKLKHLGIDEKISVIIKDYLKMRNNTQPLKEATCGCMFKNAQNDGMTCRAGLSIDIMGLKGLTLGGVRVSHKHANFMENFSGATREEVLELSRLIQSELALNFGVNFELEVDTGDR